MKFGNIWVGPLKHWHVANIQPWIQMASLWKRAPFFQRKDSPSIKDSRGWCGVSLATMSISAILLGYHIGLPITHAGSVMQRISEICLEKQKFEVCSHEERMVDPWSDHALFKLAGTSSCMVRGDPLHILFCKGLYSHLIGRILHYLCYFEGPGMRTAKKTH